MEKNELEKLVNEGLSSYSIAKKLGKGQTAILYWLTKYELGTKKLHKCRICGDSNLENFASGRYSECKKCRRKDQNRITYKHKETLVYYKGGKCEICEYNKCIAALDFHHLNPKEKDPNWEKMRHWTPERVKKEVDKCKLLCKNCHTELHYNQRVA